jgi:signal transduction histidine kinase
MARLRDLRERVRVLLDPPETERDPTGLTRLFESLRTFVRTHVLMTDGAVALIVFAVSFLSIERPQRSFAAGLLTLLLALPLACRRRAPITVFLVIAVVAFAQWLVGIVLLADIALLAALYTVAACSARRSAVAGFFILEGGAALAAAQWSPGEPAIATFALLSGVVVAALVSGLYFRARRSHVASLVERAARLEFERDQQALLAATAERARISREMHDVMAHSLAVMISLANGATAKLERDPEQSREALESISELGRQALDDTRQLLSVLRTREGTAPRAPQGIEEIADLVDRTASTGLAVTLTVCGDPVPVAAGVGLSAYRIVQEAVTNAVKHAEGATAVGVELAWTPRHLQITVANDGHGVGRSTDSAGGFGLAGMRERAALYGGTATAGPGRGGGWTVKATIPLAKRGAP